MQFVRFTVTTPWADEGWREEAALLALDGGMVELEHGSLRLTCDARVAAQVERALWQ